MRPPHAPPDAEARPHEPAARSARVGAGSRPALGRDSGLVRRQLEREARPDPGLGLQLDPAAERDRELPCDGQAEARSLTVARPERPEDELALALRHPRSGIRDADRDAAVRTVERERDAPAVRGPLECVEQRLDTIWSTRSPSVAIVGAPSRWRS